VSQQSSVRRWLAIAIACALGVGASACGSSGPQDSGGAGGAINVWALQDPTQQKFERPALERFNAQSDATAKLQVFSNTVYANKLRVAMGSPNAPDLFFNWGGGSIATYVKAGQVEDLTDYFARQPQVRDAFLPSVLKAGEIDGKPYGVPLRGMQPVLLFYNKDVFAKIGAQPPKTWDDVRALIPRLKRNDITPFVLGMQDAWTGLMWMEYFLERIGGPEPFKRLLAGDAGAWKDPAMTRALQMTRQLIDAGAFGSKFNSISYTNRSATALLAKGKGAMMLMGTWEYSNQLTDNREFAEKGLGWLAFPSIPGGKGDPEAVIGNPTNYLSVHAKSDAKQTATEFLGQMAKPEYVKDLIAAGDVPAVKDIEDELAAGPNPEFSTQVYKMIQSAPNFTLSWDQAVDPKEAEALLTNVRRFFAKQIDVGGFQRAMTVAAQT
jgi:ABC-type glycerol-3-phosphate transport system substrate-binding protein